MAFADAEEHLGTDTVRQLDLGFGPRAALEFCVEKDAPRIFESLDLVVESLSVWVGMNVLNSLVIKKELVPKDSAESMDILHKWASKALAKTNGLYWEVPNASYDPYQLLKGVWDFGFPNEASFAANVFLRRDVAGIDKFFSSYADNLSSEHFPFDIDLQILPAPYELIHLADLSPRFKLTHKRLYTAIKKEFDKSSDSEGSNTLS